MGTKQTFRCVALGILEMSFHANKPLGERMSPADLSAEDDQIGEAALADAMRTVPLGAGVLAGTMVALLVIGYLAIYLLVFLPRGIVG
jgi:hypothetical protein